MQKKYRLSFLLSFSVLLLIAQIDVTGQSHSAYLDSLKKEVHNNPSQERYVRNCFLIADKFMEVDEYDSAQLWLNRIAEKLPLKQPSLFHYLLSTRQAEVFYYNGLQQLGLQEAKRALSIAETLRDSILLADSYNFLGLFYTNLDSLSKAITYFQNGIAFSKQPPYAEQYLNLSLPFHLFGNIAEAYDKLHKLDSALYFSRISLQQAMVQGAVRGTAIAHYNLGAAFYKQQRLDSSLLHFMTSLKIVDRTMEVDVQLINYGNLALVLDKKGDKNGAMKWLAKGLALLEERPVINNLFKEQFLDNAILLYEKFDEKNNLITVLKQKAGLLGDKMRKQNHQMNIILNAGLKNETRLLSLQVKEAEQQNEIANTRVYLLISLVVLMVVAFLLYRFRAKQKLKIARLQNKISQDLHDDVGSSLSSMLVYSAVAEKLIEMRPAQAKEMLKKISKESAVVMENIGDIVWSIKPESEQSLEQRIKNFSADVLGASNMQYHVYVEAGIETLIRNIEARKNILLIIKEAVNNIVKYSKASYVSVSIKKLSGHLCVQISDDGVGFRKDEALNKGSGLSNMQKRTIELDGIYELTSNHGKGTTVSALFPLTKISDSFR